MSHEIRTPLNAIVGFSHLIAESDDAEERKTYYNIVNANNERLLQLINEILDLSKIESGTIEFSFGPASLHNLCREVHDAHIFRTPQGVSLVYESSDESLMIETDKNRVFQVISNLIGNAVKFTKEGSISYGYKLADNQIVFHVTDTGTGIEPEKVGRVFERFAKLNNHAQGTGWDYLSVSLSLNVSGARFPSAPNLVRERRLHLLYHTRLQILQMWILQRKRMVKGTLLE